MNEVTIVCCYNNEKVYNDFVNTLKSQTLGYDLIGIDNRGNNRFTSCAGAYNSVINDVKTKYVIYSHQDILLTEPDMLQRFISDLECITQNDILGVAGMRFEERECFSNIRHMDRVTGKIMYPAVNALKNGMIECDTFDECFFGGYTEHFREYPFDEVVCDNWHLYAVEACLNAKINKGHVYVSDISIIHLSYGYVNFTFVCGFCRLCRKYAKNFPFIRTTCTYSKTDNFYLCLYVLRYCLWTKHHRALREFAKRIICR
ncbi:MAG: hypothetical protein IJS42_03395 [Synergistaceae bacterium]|nr:hypothetical protein [Synergistaceae bacterium]